MVYDVVGTAGDEAEVFEDDFESAQGEGSSGTTFAEVRDAEAGGDGVGTMV